MSKQTHPDITLPQLYHMVIDSKTELSNGQALYNIMQQFKANLSDKKQANQVSALQIAYVSFYNHYRIYLSEKEMLTDPVNADVPEYQERLRSHLFATESAQRELDAQLEHFYRAILY